MHTKISQKLLHTVIALSKVRTMDQVAEIVRSAARELTSCDGATFVLRDGDKCAYMDEDAIGPLWKGQKFPMEMCISGWVMMHKESVTIPDIFKDPRIPLEAYQPTFVKSLAMVPIRKEDPLGAIGTYWAKPYQPTEEEVEVLQALADTTSVALENLQLYSYLEDRVQRLDAANRQKDDLLMMVSHELRTPLNVILGWSEVLSSEGVVTKEEIQEGISTIQSNAKLQARIVDDLLDASEIVLGRLRLYKQDLDLEEVIQEAVEGVSILADAKGLKTSIKLPGKRVMTSGDPARITQVVHNILSNAMKFTPPGGKIEVRLSVEGPMAKISVSDTGEGMDEELTHSIFEPFKQAETVSSRRHGGLGLGLTIVKHIVTAHGGKVTATSAGKGKGATFNVYVPLKATAA